eukprot:jgi/Picre1/35790/NNA_003250.t1
MGAKQTSQLIPLCHPILLSDVSVSLTLDEDALSVGIWAQATTVGPTGVEMEALTAASVAALTVYDMCKAASKMIEITDIVSLKRRVGKVDIGRGGISERRIFRWRSTSGHIDIDVIPTRKRGNMLVETNWTRSSSKTAATKPNSISSGSLISIVRVHSSTMAVNANSSGGGGLRGGWKHDQSLGMHFDLDVGSKDEHILSRFGFCDEDEDLEPGKLEILKSDVMRFTRPVNMFHARLQRDVASMKRRIVEEEGDM